MLIRSLIVSISEVFGHPEPQVNLLPGEALVVSFSGKVHHYDHLSLTDPFDRLLIILPSPVVICSLYYRPRGYLVCGALHIQRRHHR